MEVQLRFHNKTHEFSIPDDATVDYLMELIDQKLSIPKSNQKIIFRGKPLTIPTEPIGNKHKLLLMTQSKPVELKEQSTMQTRGYSMLRPQIIDTLKEQNHQNIIAHGPPEGGPAPGKFQTSVLPQGPMYILNNEGKRSVLKIESDAIFVQADDGFMERIFISDMIRTKSLPIPENESYFATGILTKNGTRWLYFIPYQYFVFIRTILPQ